MSEYDRVIEKLKERLLEKHQMYGLSYKGKPYFMFLRLQEETEELRKELMSGSILALKEGLDVAICGLLIADIIIDWMDAQEKSP